MYIFILHLSSNLFEYLSFYTIPIFRSNCWLVDSGVKIITCPGVLNFRQDKHIFSTNVLQTSKKFSASLFFLEYSVSDNTFWKSY